MPIELKLHDQDDNNAHNGIHTLKSSPESEARWPWDLVCSIEMLGLPSYFK